MKKFAKRSLAIFMTVIMLFSVMAVGVSSVSAVTTEDPEDAVISLSGSFNDWSLSKNVFSYMGESMFYASVVLSPGTYTFKVVKDGLWYGSNTIIKDTTSDIKMSITSGDCAIDSKGGQFEFHYDLSKHVLHVVFNEMEFEQETKVPTVALSGSFNDWVSTELMTKPSATIVYFPASDPSQTTLNTALASIGVDNSKEYRMKIALANGMTDYAYTPEQNTAMLKLLKAGKLINPDASVTEVPKDTLSKTLKLKKGEYYFSIVEDGLWYGDTNLAIYDTTDGEVMKVNGGACVLKTMGGTYTFLYNYNTNTIRITAELDSNPTDLAVVSLAGNFNDWNSKDYMKTTSGVTVEKTLELKAGIYYFKVVQDGLWYGNSGTIENTTTTTSDTGWDMSIAFGDCTLEATGGTYKFIFTVTTKKLVVEYVPSDETPAELSNATLAGDFNNWDKNATALKPITDTVVQTTVTLTQGVYAFKIVEDNLWYGNGETIIDKTTGTGTAISYTGGNCVLKATGGDYTFTYDVVKKWLLIDAKISTSAPVKLANVSLAGDFNGWDTGANKMTAVSDTTVSATVTLKAGAFNFKIVKNALWYGSATRISNTTKDLTLDYTAGDCVIITSGGSYTFTFDVVTNSLTVTYVASIQDPAKTANVALSSNFNNWSTTKNKFTYYATNQVATTVDLDYGTYIFKVVYENLWYGSPEEIYDVTDDAIQLDPTATECTLEAYGGTYTFIFDVVTKELKIRAVLSDLDPAETAIVSIAGDFNGWVNGENMLWYYDTNTVATALEIPAGSYLFKIVQDDLWYGSNTEIVNTTVSTNGPVEFSIYDGECKLDALGGIYTFIYNVVTRELEITFEEAETDYTKNAVVSLAGEFNDWNTAATPMTSLSYEDVYVDVYLEPGSYYFKVVHDGCWYGNTGAVIKNEVDDLKTSNTASDIKLTATKAGTYSFIYNVVTNRLFVSYFEEDFAEWAYVNLVGDFNDWDEEDTPFEYVGKGMVSVTMNLKAGTYKFKVLDEFEWLGNEGVITNSTQSTSDIGWAMTANAPDCTLKATGGSYTFNYNVNTNFLEVIYNGK